MKGIEGYAAKLRGVGRAVNTLISGNANMPVVVEIVDKRENIDKMLPWLEKNATHALVLVKEHGGHSIAVYDNEDKQKTACQLVKEGRVNFMCSANYSKGSVMNIIVKRILDKIKADFEFDRLIELNQKKAWK